MEGGLFINQRHSLRPLSLNTFVLQEKEINNHNVNLV